MKHILIIALLLSMTGCISANYRPHTAREKQLLALAITLGGADCVSTSIAFSTGRFEEGNGFWWNPEDTASMLSSKVVLIGLAYLWGNVYPDSREWTYGGLAGSWCGAAAWNTYQLSR